MAVSENECKHSLAAIEKISQSKVKLNNKKKPIRDEEESESDLNNEDALTDGEITVDEDDDENNALVIEEQFSSVNKENVSKGKSFSQNVVLASSFNQSMIIERFSILILVFLEDGECSTKSSKRKEVVEADEVETPKKRCRPSFLST